MSNTLNLQKELAEVKPTPLPENTKQLPEFTKDMLPDRLVNYVFKQAEKGQLTASALAISAITGIAGVIGKKAILNIGSRTINANVWGLIIGESGSGKTPHLRAVNNVIKELDDELLKKYEEKEKEYNLAIETLDTQIKEVKESIKKDFKDGENQKIVEKQQKILELENDKPHKPFSNEIIFSDGSTHQAIMSKIANDCPNGILLNCIEFYKTLQTLSSKDNADKQSMFLRSYDGDFDKSITLGRGTTSVKKMLISIIGDRHIKHAIDQFLHNHLVS